MQAINQQSRRERLAAYRRNPFSLFLAALVTLSAVITLAVLISLIIYILYKGIPNLKPSLFAWNYNTENVSMMPAIINTLSITAMTLLFSEHHTLDGGVFIFQGKVAVAAFVMARKVGNLAADDEVIQWFALLQHLFSQQVQGGYIDVFGHALISLAARMDTPMALSLANLPGTK